MDIVCKICLAIIAIAVATPILMVAGALLHSVWIEHKNRKRHKHYAKEDLLPCEQDLSVSPFEK